MNDSRRAVVWGLLTLGLLGHVFAAYRIGGSRIAYGHHIFGFFFILVVTGAIIAVMGRFLWRDRPQVTWLAVAAVQALFGVIIFFMAHHIA